MNRHTIRYVAAGLSAAIAAIYFLIGIGVLVVVDPAAGAPDAPPMLIFGASAGGAFLLGAVLLAEFDRRWLWILGAALQLMVAWGYFTVAADRTPAFETWGITLRIIQVPLLAALVYLAVRPAEPDAAPLVPIRTRHRTH